MNSRPSPAQKNAALLADAVPFGYKTAWFAIRSEDIGAVAGALELQNVYRSNWQYGVWRAVESDEYSVFVTPPVNGWTLAVGVPILFEADSRAIERMTELSRRFGQAQFFASMRTSDSYVWGRAANGKLVRQFYEGEGERREQGERTKEEEALGLKFFDASSPESKGPQYWERQDLVQVDEEYVLKIAGLWSVNPLKLGELGLTPSLGLLGNPSASYPPKAKHLSPKQPGLIRRILGR